MGELRLDGFGRSPGVAPPPPPAPEVTAETSPVQPTASRPARRPAKQSPRRAVAGSAPTGARLTVNVDIATRRWLRNYSRVVGMTLAEVLEAALAAHGAAVGAGGALRGPADPAPIHLVLSPALREQLEALRDETGPTLSAVVSELLVRAQAAVTPEEIVAAASRRLAGG